MSIINFSITFLIISTILLPIVKTPINRLSLLIITYLCASLIFINLEFTFIGLTYLIVYVGAIAILFVFVIMMLPMSIKEKTNSKYLSLLLIISALLYLNSQVDIYNLIYKYNLPKYQIYTLTDINTLAQTIYVVLPLSLIIIAILLWILLIGIISVISQ